MSRVESSRTRNPSVLRTCGAASCHSVSGLGSRRCSNRVKASWAGLSEGSGCTRAASKALQTLGVAAKKSMRRVHVVEEPLSDYLRYEMLSYRPNVEAGEDVRILPVTPGRWPNLPLDDYWLFDSAELWLMDYDEDGHFTGVVPVTDAVEIVMANHWRDAALHAAVPYADYVRRL